jgi:hypothetical protein
MLRGVVIAFLMFGLTQAWAAEPTAEAQAIAAGAKLLSVEELKGFYLGRTVIGEAPSGYRFRTSVKSDGSIPANERRGAGTLTISAPGKACMHFAELWEGKPRCWTHYRIGETIKDFHEDGTLAATLKSESGD